MKYKLKHSGTGGKWTGWRKTDKTEQEIKAMHDNNNHAVRAERV